MNKYEFIVDGIDKYEVEANNAYEAFVEWVKENHDPRLIEELAENELIYRMNLTFKKIQ